MGQLNKLLAVVFFDKWNNRALIVGLICMIAMLFAPTGSALDWTTFSIGATMLAVIVFRSVYLVMCMRRGESVLAEPPQAVRLRDRISSALWIAFLVCGVVLIVLKYVR